MSLTQEQIQGFAQRLIDGDDKWRYSEEFTSLFTESDFEVQSDARREIEQEAKRMSNPFSIKIGPGHLPKGTKFRVLFDYSNVEHNGKVFEVASLVRNSHGNILVRTTSYNEALEMNHTFNIDWISQIVEIGKGHLTWEHHQPQLVRAAATESAAYHKLYTTYGENSKMQAGHGLREEVMMQLISLSKPGHGIPYDLSLIMENLMKNAWVKQIHSGHNYSFTVWPKKKLKKWIKANAKRFLWSNAKQAKLDAEYDMSMSESFYEELDMADKEEEKQETPHRPMGERFDHEDFSCFEN